MVEIRPATLADLDGIMAVEIETFGPVGQGAAASRETMTHRIRLLNRESPVTSGGYVMLNPASGLSGERMVREACSTIEWVLESGSAGTSGLLLPGRAGAMLA